MADSVPFHFVYEHHAAKLPGPLEQFGLAIEQALTSGAGLGETLRWLKASHVAGNILGSECRPSPNASHQRLRAIRGPEGELLTCAYDQMGRPASVHFVDGQFLRWDWSQAPQQTTVWLSDRHSIRLTCDSEAQLREVCHDDCWSTHWSFSDYRLADRTDCDGERVAYTWQPDGRLQDVRTAGMTCEWQYGGDGAATELRCHYDGSRCRLQRGRSLRLDMARQPRSAGEPTALLSALGRWWYDANGRLLRMEWPNGQRMGLACSDPTRPDIVWSDTGASRHNYDETGTLASSLSWRGDRRLFHRLADPYTVCLLDARSVGLGRYDRQGRLQSLRFADGDYRLYGYTPSGQLRCIETPVGAIGLRQDPQGHLTEIKLTQGIRARLQYSSDGLPERVDLSARNYHLIEAMLAINHVLWELRGLKPTLRLADFAVREN